MSIKVTRGDTSYKSFKYLDKDKNPIKISETAVIKMTVKKDIDGEKLFSKEIKVINYNDETNEYSYVILPEETENVKMFGKKEIVYKYDYQFEDIIDGIKVVETIGKGDFVILYDITTPEKEITNE